MFDRMRRGWELTKKAWGVVRSHPGLAKLPLTGGALALLAVIVIGGPGAALMSIDNTGTKVLGAILLVLAAYLASFAIIYYNVALAAGADQALRGQEPDIAAAKGVARSRIGLIAAWAAVSAAISILMALLRDRAGAAGGIVAGIGGAIWSLITFLVVPVLAFEGIGPVDAIKRSAHLFRQRWGQQVTGNVVIGGIAGLAVFVGIAIGVLGVVVIAIGDAAAIALGVVLLLIGLVAAIAGAVFGGATRGVFGVALYHYVSANQVIGPFTATDMEGTARSRR
jgi:Family of unknown function (DUF6159)